MAWQGLPRLHCCAGSSLRCSGRAVRWAASSVQQSALHHHADVTAASGQLHVPQCRAGTPLAAVPLQQRRRPLRTVCSSGGAAAGSNGSSEAEGRFVITTPLYYVNAGAFAVFALVLASTATTLGSRPQGQTACLPSSHARSFTILDAAPHLGGAYSTMAVDVMARYQVHIF